MRRDRSSGKLRLVFFLALAVILSGGFAPSEAGTGYVIGVVPQMPPVTMYARWQPFVERLSRETGLDFKLKVYEKMSDFEGDINQEAPDLIFSNPVQAAQAFKVHGYIPIVRGSAPIEAVLFVRADSDIRSVDDLKNREVAFVGSKNV